MISLVPTSEQVAIVDSVGALVDDAAPLSRLLGDGCAERELELLDQLSSLGLFLLSLSEEQGGMASDWATMALIFRRLGRNLVTPSAAARVLAAHIGDSAHAAFAIPGTSGALLLDAVAAERILLWDDAALALMPADVVSDRVSIQSLDAALPVARGTIDAGAAIVPAENRLIDAGHILIASLQVGLADAALHMSVEYAGTREQFGRPIGAFQAIKHRCANMAVAVEVAWSQTLFAALAHDAKRPDAPRLARAARILASTSSIENAEGNIQIHGGIGFTEEAYPHLLVRRAQLLARIGGDRRAHQEMLLEAQFGDAT